MAVLGVLALLVTVRLQRVLVAGVATVVFEALGVLVVEPLVMTGQSNEVHMAVGTNEACTALKADGNACLVLASNRTSKDVGRGQEKERKKRDGDTHGWLASR